MAEYIISTSELSGIDGEWLTKHEQVIRCRDCKYHELQTVVYSSKPLSVCTAEWCEGAERDNPLVEPDGYCAWGEPITANGGVGGAVR